MVENKKEYLSILQSDLNFKPEDVRESVYKKFNQQIIINQYENLFIKIYSK